MPGISDGKANTRDYLLGRGKLYAGDLLANGLPAAWRFLGNAPSVKFSVETEVARHFQSQSGLRSLDKRVITSLTGKLALTLDEFNLDNLAAFFQGDTTTFSQASATVTVASTNFNLTVTKKGRWYDLYDDINHVAYPEGNRVYALTSFTSLTTTADVAITTANYEVDLAMGRIFIKNDAPDAIFNSLPVNLKANFVVPAKTIHIMRGIKAPLPAVAFKFILDNPADNDQLSEIKFHRVNLTPTGDMTLIGENEFGAFDLEGEPEAVPSIFPNSPVFDFVTIP